MAKSQFVEHLIDKFISGCISYQILRQKHYRRFIYKRARHFFTLSGRCAKTSALAYGIDQDRTAQMYSLIMDLYYMFNIET